MANTAPRSATQRKKQSDLTQAQKDTYDKKQKAKGKPPTKAKDSPKKASPKKPASSGIHEVPTKTLENELKRRSRTEGTTDKPKASRWTPAGKTAHKYRGGNK